MRRVSGALAATVTLCTSLFAMPSTAVAVAPGRAHSVATTATPPGLDECPILRESASSDESASFAGVELGAGSTLSQALNAKQEWAVEDDADLKFGGRLAFGGRLGKVGLGVSGDLAAGISIGAGLGFDGLTEAEDRALTTDLLQGQLTSTLAQQPSTVSVDAGVWLNGGIDVAGPADSKFSLEGEITAAIGYQLDLDYEQGTRSITGQSVTFSASGGLTTEAAGDFQPLKPLSFNVADNAHTEGAAQLTINFSPNYLLTGFETALTATATWSTSTNLEAAFALKHLPFTIGGKHTNTQGNAVTYLTKVDLDTSSAAASSAENTLLAAMLDTSGTPAPTESDIEDAIATLNPHARSLLFDSDVIEQASADDIQVAVGLGFSLTDSKSHAQRRTVDAWWGPPGSTVMLPWTDCDNRLLPAAVHTATTTTTTPVVPSTTTTAPTQRLVISTDGHVGTLQIGKSTENDIRSALGPPDQVGRGKEGEAERQLPEFRSLGYGCSTTEKTWRSINASLPGGPPYCQTIYYVYASNDLLGAFWTASSTYQTAAGTTVGMTFEEAQSRELAGDSFCGNPGIPLGDSGTTAQVVITPTTSTVVSIDSDSTRDPIGIELC